MRQYINFGGNIRFQPKAAYRPRTEVEVIDILKKHRGESIRAIGSLHSWSEAPTTNGIVIDMHRLNKVKVTPHADGIATVVAQAGCRLQRLLDQIHTRSNSTLPTLGAIKRQTVSGIISTATHGSGKHSLSHYIDSMRVLRYDPNGEPTIYELTGGTELFAARCALGCLGIILSVTFQAVPKYLVEERIVRRDSVESILADDARFPLQQFVLIPYAWTYYQYQRSVVTRPRSWSAGPKQWCYRAYKWIAVDVASHLSIRLMLGLASMTSERVIQSFFRMIAPHTILTNVSVVDDSEPALTLRHDLFTHTEMELYVPQSYLPAAVVMLRKLIEFCAGRVQAEIPTIQEIQSSTLFEEINRLRGTYTHHYPIVFRKVLPDDTLISPTSGMREPCYTISLFTFRPPDQRFRNFARLVAKVFAKLFQARLHWGKFFPLDYADYELFLPGLAEFKNQRLQADPNRRFLNSYTTKVLSLEQPGETSS